MTARQKKKQAKKIAENQTYENYVAQYETRRRNLGKSEIPMYMRKYTKEEWKRQYALMKAETNEPNINRLLVDRGAYAYSEAQATKYKKALMEHYQKNFTRRDIMTKSYQADYHIKRLLEDIEVMDTELYLEGRTGKERQRIIGAMFFGSI